MAEIIKEELNTDEFEIKEEIISIKEEILLSFTVESTPVAQKQDVQNENVHRVNVQEENVQLDNAKQENVQKENVQL